MAVDLTGIQYTVTYRNTHTFNSTIHDDTFGINLNNQFLPENSMECALIQVERAYDGWRPTELFMVVEGPPRATMFYGEPLEDILKVYVKFIKTRRPWPSISLMFPEDIGLPNNVPVDEAIRALADVSTTITPRLDLFLSFSQSLAILMIMGKGDVVANIGEGVTEEEAAADAAAMELALNGAIANAPDLKSIITKAAVAGNIFNSFGDCVVQAAFVFLFDCCAIFESEVESWVSKIIDKTNTEAFAVIGEVAKQIDAAIDIIQTAALLPLTHALKNFVDPILSNGKYLADVFLKYEDKISRLVESLPLGMLVDIGKCMMDDPEIANMLRTKDRILGLAKDLLIQDEATNLFEIGYPGVGSLRHSLLALTAGTLFYKPTAKFRWQVALPWYLDVWDEVNSRESYILALNEVPSEGRFSWDKMASVMQKHTTIKSNEEFTAFNNTIVYPDYITPMADAVTGETAISLLSIAAELGRSDGSEINIAVMQAGFESLRGAYADYTRLSEYAVYEKTEATATFDSAKRAFDDAVANDGLDPNNTVSPEYTLLMYATEEKNRIYAAAEEYETIAGYLSLLVDRAETTCMDAERLVRMASAGDAK